MYRHLFQVAALVAGASLEVAGSGFQVIGAVAGAGRRYVSIAGAGIGDFFKSQVSRVTGRGFLLKVSPHVPVASGSSIRSQVLITATVSSRRFSKLQLKVYFICRSRSCR